MKQEKIIEASKRQPLVNIIDQANRLRSGARVVHVETASKGEGESLHLWHLDNGQTLVLTRNARGFTGVKKTGSPLRYVRAQCGLPQHS